jgi:hypothetical protein
MVLAAKDTEKGKRKKEKYLDGRQKAEVRS